MSPMNRQFSNMGLLVSLASQYINIYVFHVLSFISQKFKIIVPQWGKLLVESIPGNTRTKNDINIKYRL